MKRVLSAVAITILGLAWLPGGHLKAAPSPLGPACQAAPSSPLCAENGPQTPGSNKIYGRGSVLAKVVSLIATVTGIAAIIVIMIGGIRYAISSGDPSNINNAKNTILFALIGLGVAAIAQAIVVFVLRKLP